MHVFPAVPEPSVKKPPNYEPRENTDRLLGTEKIYNYRSSQTGENNVHGSNQITDESPTLNSL